MKSSSTLCVPETGSIPRHIAIIMDGNGRWATRRFMPRTAGHAKGVQAVRRVVEYCGANGIDYLTLFAFSSENWRRPQEEVSLLMKLFVQALEKEVSRLNSNNVRLRVVGDLSPFEPYLQKLIRDAEAVTNGNSGLTLTIAANYGGRWDILQAFRKMLQAHPELAQETEQVSEQMLNEYLCMHWAPEPDLFIRTGGESRISNFLVWQLAYTELYFTDCYWPDFGAKDMDRAIEWYRGRERRFGRTSAQISDDSPSA
ncbi:polyprenyl diphosphate synthase [Advenella mimigardefordensis]|uniref:Isoprenyl transferase n=1 Tax=Advenella mimigardefordensis (strain DSM 17166 / LMG 22922 / DPN7) TaxID=1247726 RepID=W0PEQ9_ADVMD|nr:polyprenyl diphosphate synthase [Advenella mimigardefordensis]AHG64017.1 undecaprenyl pyrophosphate synthase [Advenella mimigardefordensis DPN7]